MIMDVNIVSTTYIELYDAEGRRDGKLHEVCVEKRVRL